MTTTPSTGTEAPRMRSPVEDPGSPGWAHSAGPERRPTSAEDVSLLELLTPLVRRWKLLLGIPISLGVLAGMVSLLLPPVYTAETTVTPVATSPGGAGASALASLAGLAGQLGVATGGGTALSPDFIANVLKSREVLTSTVESRFQDPDGGRKEVPLLEILGVEGRTERTRLNQGVHKLRKSVQARVDRSTGIVTLTVKARDPKLAADIANRIVVILERFNLERRQSQSREQARFTRERMIEAADELRQAEAAQLRFLQANREYGGSPMLEFQSGRLQRAVDLKQEVYVSLVKAYDEARIAEVRDTPVITTIDSAVAPDQPSAPRPVLNIAIALLAGGVIAFVLVFLLQQRAQGMGSSTQGHRAFRSVSSTARGRDPTPAE